MNKTPGGWQVIEKRELPYGRPMSEEERETYLRAPSLGYYERIFASMQEELIPYYRSWMHNDPMIVSLKRDEELRKVQQVLYKACCHYAARYRDYLDLISYDEKILELLAYVGDKRFEAGTFRPDYLICEDGSLRVCEITSRFFGNGYFLSYFTEHAGRVFAKEAGVKEAGSYFEEFLEYMAKMPKGKKKLAVLKSADKSDSIKLYVPYYEALGMEAVIYEADEVEAHLENIKDAFIVSALNQKDLLSFSMETLKFLADHDMRNDFRTVFLLHDKRFFALFECERFTSECLSEEETRFLKDHTVKTYLYGTREEIWEDARYHKDKYILKHRCLGKSESVYAGCLTDADVWERLFADGEIKNMILQPFMKQRIFSTDWEGERLDDYICGTILTVDDRYFGTGLFRSSTSPVINQVDAHKAAAVVTDRAECFAGAHIL